MRVSANRSFPGLLFAVNGRPYDFNPLPGGWDVNASAHYRSPAAGTFKLFVNSAGDHVGVGIDSLNFNGLLRSSTHLSSLASLHWENVIGGAWLATATVGVTRYVRGLDVGVLNLDTTDLRASWRATAERALGAWTLRAGGDGIDARTHLDGVVPVVGGDLGGTAGAQPIAVRYGDAVGGAYVEVERHAGRVTTTAGGRVERFDLAGQTAADPRLNVPVDTVPHQKSCHSHGACITRRQEPAYYG